MEWNMLLKWHFYSQMVFLAIKLDYGYFGVVLLYLGDFWHDSHYPKRVNERFHKFEKSWINWLIKKIVFEDTIANKYNDCDTNDMNYLMLIELLFK